MKKIICTSTLFFCCLFYSQSADQIKSIIDSSRIEFTQIRDQYSDLLGKTKTLIYEQDGYSYYSKLKYDSLVKSNLNDSIILNKSILKISMGQNEYYIMKMMGFQANNYDFYKYKGNQLLSVERLNQFKETYSKDDFKTLTSYSYCGKSDCINKYQFGKFSKLSAEKQLSDILYSMRVDRLGVVYEQFYDKDFPIDEKMLLKIFISKFTKQSLALMKGAKYSRGHGSPSKEFDAKDLEYEINFMKNSIAEKQKVATGFYDSKDLILKLRAEGGVGTDKTYDSSNKPYYRLIFNYDMKRWEFKVNPVTGDIENIQYNLVHE